MSKEKNKESVNKNFQSIQRFRWGILFSVTVLFSIILFPNLVITKHQYKLGDVAERDVKSPRDFFIEDKAATQSNRQQAKEAVLTVYDYDAGLAAGLTGKVDEVFAEMRAAAAVPAAAHQISPAAAGNDTRSSAETQNPSQSVVIDKRKYLENKLGIRVSKGAFAALEKVGFSKEISELILSSFKSSKS